MTAGPHPRSGDGLLLLPPGVSSCWTDLGGPVHYLDFGGPADAPVIVCVHGLGGSAVNWLAIAPLLADRFRLLAPDLAGHGLTRSQGRSTDVKSNRVLLDRFIEAVPGSPVILMGNSMGGMISLLEASAAAAKVTDLILLDPALPFVLVRPDPAVTAILALSAAPGLGRVIAASRRRMSPEAAVADVLALCCADASRVPADVVATHVDMARRRAGFTEVGRDFAIAARSVISTAGRLRGSPYRRGVRSISCPVLLLHGSRDRLVPVAAARGAARANPSWTLVVLPDIGHVPQLEAPQDCARVISQWLGSRGSPGTKGAGDQLQPRRHSA
jgi:pimeloyl-ACP methyl ester carboxylesterase